MKYKKFLEILIYICEIEISNVKINYINQKIKLYFSKIKQFY